MAGIAAVLILHDDFAFLDRAIESVIDAGPVFAFVSRVPWHGEPGDWEQAAAIAEEAGAEVVLGEWPSEEEHRRFALAYLAEKGFTHALIPDGDEEIESRLRAESQVRRAERREARGVEHAEATRHIAALHEAIAQTSSATFDAKA